MNRAALQAILSHWRRNPLQLFTLIAGLALATALWSGVQAVNTEARASYDAAAATLGEGQYDQIIAPDGSHISRATFVALRRAGWLVSPVVEGRLNGVRLIGVEPLTAPNGLGQVLFAKMSELGAFLGAQRQVFAAADALEKLDGEIDAALVLEPDLAPGTAITDIGVALQLLGDTGGITRLIVAQEQPLVQGVLADIAPDLSLRAARGGSDIGRLTDSFHLNLTAFGMLSFAVGIFIVNAAIGLAFEQRRPVVRTLRALGMPLRRLMLLMAAELLIFALIAGAIGVMLGYGIAALLMPDVAATLHGLYGADVAGTLQLRPAWWLSGLAIAVGGTAIAASGAFWRLAHLPLLASAHPRALAMSAERDATMMSLAALALLAIAGLLAMFGTGLLAGFAMLAALLIGAALALPYLLDRALALGQWMSRGVVASWFWADTRQQLPGLSLALMALLLAMAANVGVSTMVSSFRLTFTGFLDQRLASELYVSVDTAEQAVALQEFLAPRVDAVLPIQSQQIEIAGQPTEVFGPRDHATYRDNWVFLQSIPDAWDLVAKGDVVLVNEQMARRAGLVIGKMVSVAGKTLPIAGIYGDYGNPIGQAIIGEQLFGALFPQVVPRRFGVRIAGADVATLVVALEDDFGLSASNVIDQAGIKAFSLGVFNRTFTVTAALNVLTLAVAGFAILMSLLTLATMRLPQLAPVWALGLTRSRLGQLELIRTVLLAVLTSVLALPLGLALAWVLLAVVNVEAFGWRLPMFFFPADYARLGGFALLAAVLAALWPAWRLARTPPADLLKVFSNER